MSDEELTSSLQSALARMGAGGGEGTMPNPDVPLYTLGLSSMVAAQFSGLLQQASAARRVGMPIPRLVGCRFYTTALWHWLGQGDKRVSAAAIDSHWSCCA